MQVTNRGNLVPSIGNLPMGKLLQGAEAQRAKNAEKAESGKVSRRPAESAASLPSASRAAESSGALSAAGRNAQDGLSMLRVADGALGSVQDAMNRMQELAGRAGGVSSDEERGAMQQEFLALAQQIDDTGESALFGGERLFDGSTYSVQRGGTSGGSTELTMREVSARAFGLRDASLNTAEGATAASKRLRASMEDVSRRRGELDTARRSLESAYRGARTADAPERESLSRVSDAAMSKDRPTTVALNRSAETLMDNAQYMMPYNAMKILFG